MNLRFRRSTFWWAKGNELRDNGQEKRQRMNADREKKGCEKKGQILLEIPQNKTIERSKISIG